jgi:hypothetical protein
MHEKKQLERAALEEFGQWFTVNAGRGEFRLVELLDPPKLDSRCRIGEAEVYVEVAHVYGTETDAKTLLGRTGVGAPDSGRHRRDALISFDRRVIVPLNTVLQEKAGKTYDGSPVWLVIRNGFPLMDQADFESYADQIIVPDVHPFTEIWLLCGRSAENGALRLI